MQIYVDLDGVLADFDAGYARVAGRRPDGAGDDVDWNLVRATPDFYLNLPPMADYAALWAVVSHLRPIVLTGVPVGVPEAAANKRAWVARWLPGTPVIPTLSREKYKQARPGDVLIDDRDKYRAAWEGAGGIFVLHTSAYDTERRLRAMGLR